MTTTPYLIVTMTRPPAVTLSDIAREAGVSLTFVSHCAHGRKRPTAKVRAAAESLLGIPADQLFAPTPEGKGTP